MELPFRPGHEGESQMAIEILLIALAVVLFGGMFLGLLLSYREAEADRTTCAAAADVVSASSFYGGRPHDAAIAEELMLRQIEHHLRREAMIAEQFINNPSPQTLRAGDDDLQLRMKAC